MKKSVILYTKMGDFASPVTYRHFDKIFVAHMYYTTVASNKFQQLDYKISLLQCYLY